MQISSYHFRPRPVPTLVTLVLLPVLVGLGFWQLDRAEQKREILDSVEGGARQAVVDLNARQPGYRAVRHHPARLSGRYDSARQFLLDNQVHDSRVGYRVLTPMRTEAGAILVDRGWVPAPRPRDQLPEVAVDEQRRTITGVIDDGPGVGLRMGEAWVESRWPRRLNYLDYEAVAEALPYELAADYLVRLDPKAPDGYERHWEPVEFSPARHVGYAVQWFALAAALLAIYIGVNTKRGKQ